MSEANSIAGTVGTWVSPFLLLLLTTMVAYMTRHITPSDDTERKRLLRQTARDVGHLRRDYHETLQVLLRIEKMAIEVKNESGDVLVLQRVPRSSAQVSGAPAISSHFYAVLVTSSPRVKLGRAYHLTFMCTKVSRPASLSSLDL